MSLVEVMVAAFVLAVGVLGVVAVIDRANAATSANKAREGGTNVAREVIENASALPYREVTRTTLPERLRSRPGLADSDANAASGWTVVRRGREGDAGEIRYTVEASVCFVDDANDGTGAHDTDFCAESPPAGSGDTTPKDYKRVDATVTWTDDVGRPATVRQSAIVTGKDIPAVTSLSGLPVSVVTTPIPTIDFTALTSAPAGGVSFTQDGGEIGTATGGPTAWDFDWDISSLVDGNYVIAARAYGDQGEYGAPMQMDYILNRFVPVAPENFVAGVNGTKVDAEWSANSERDIVGYRVYKQGPFGGTVRVNCGTAGAPVPPVETKTTCTDADPLATAGGSGGSISARSSSSSATSGTTLTVNSPQGAVAGDVLVATVGTGIGQVTAAPSGWTLIRSTVQPDPEGVRQVSFFRVVGSGEPASYSFAGASSGMAGGITAYTGVDTRTPIDASGEAVGTKDAATAPSVTTTRAGAAVVVASTHRGDDKTELSAPTGTTTRWVFEKTGSGGHLAADFSQATAGATPTRSIGCGGGPKSCQKWVAQTIALRPRVAVDYWVRAIDSDPSGNPREGAESTRVNAYAPNTPPTAPTGLSGVVEAGGSTRIDWTGAGTDPDAGDSVAFYRVYRDGVYYDRTNGGGDATWTDGDTGGVQHDYYLKAVDTHLAESPASVAVRR
jgi:hypothetical protein